MRQTFEEQLQISEFIKDPASLKLLILAGTNIRAHELATVNKCVSLIKLDLSSNQLTEVPLKFTAFPQLKILYLHDNQLSAISITRTNLEYVSLFDNPVREYRGGLIEGNDKLMAIDHHVISKAERLFKTTPHPFAQLKWPIVEISQPLEHEEDYLNLLKAELFVVGQVYKRANFAHTLNRYFLAFNDTIQYHHVRHTLTNQAFFDREVVMHWKEYTKKKAKLRRLLQGTPAEPLLMSKLQRIKMNLSGGVNEVMKRFLKSVRERMAARLVLARSMAAYRSNIPPAKHLQKRLEEDPMRLYFLESQAYFLEKLFLYAKKLFFNRKAFDILDNFDQLVVRSKKIYYIYRKRERDEADTVLMDMVRNSMGLILAEKGLDRRSFLYNRQGHKWIQIKRVKRVDTDFDRERTRKADEKMQRLYCRYDVLVEYEFKNKEIYQTFLRLIKYFNAGNSSVILQNQAAYFQTEVVFQDKAPPKRQKLFFSCYYFTRRVIAANTVQKWWRRMRAVRKGERNIVRELRVDRAQNLIGRWLRDLTFRHRNQLGKLHSFRHSTFKDVELYMQLDIYMHLPPPTDLLRIKKTPPLHSSQILYSLLHKNTESQIVEMSGRSWIKLRFLSSADAFEAAKQLSVLTYRYYFNGTFLRLFSHYELNFPKDLTIYQSRVAKLLGLKVNAGQETSNRTVKRIQIDNCQPYFIWPFLEQGFAGMFKAEEVQSLPISVFIYNKNRRPLKVNCDLMWIAPSTLYHFRKRAKPQVRVRTPKKEKAQEAYLEHYLPMPLIQHKLKRQRQFSMKQHKSLLQANRQRGQSQHVQLSLLSQTLNIKRQ